MLFDLFHWKSCQVNLLLPSTSWYPVSTVKWHTGSKSTVIWKPRLHDMTCWESGKGSDGQEEDRKIEANCSCLVKVWHATDSTPAPLAFQGIDMWYTLPQWYWPFSLCPSFNVLSEARLVVTFPTTEAVGSCWSVSLPCVDRNVIKNMHPPPTFSLGRAI